MKKFGFTLAEVLITLGIIGVVAALTAPALTKNAGSAKIGPTLAKFVNTFESACETYMHQEGSSTISETTSDTKGLMKSLMQYMIMTPYKESYTIYKTDGTSFTSLSADMYQLKDGSIVVIGNDTIKNAAESFAPSYSKKGSYKGSEGFILYDINGPKGTNKIGREVFAFVIDDSGVLVPYGGNAFKYLAANDNAGSGSEGSGDEGSGGDDGVALDNLGFYKTGEIADNGWKAE